MNNIGVLVVDDTKDTRLKLVSGLKEKGFKEVVGVSNGEDAIRLIMDGPFRFNVTVIDHNLNNPELDGIETTKQIVKHSKKYLYNNIY